MKSSLKKCLDYIILHFGTNSSVHETSKRILDEFLKLKVYIVDSFPLCRVIIRNIIGRVNSGKASLTVRRFDDLPLLENLIS